MKRHRIQPTTSARRRGSIAVPAMICLLLVGGLLASAVKVSMTGREQVRRDQLRMQAAWLVNAGVQRAAARLADEADYEGETWNIAAEAFDGRRSARVVINVKPVPTENNRRAVTVEASYPQGETPSARRTRTVILPAGME